MIDNLRGDVPVVVIRPSVIESTHKEPFPGWMEGNRYLLMNNSGRMQDFKFIFSGYLTEIYGIQNDGSNNFAIREGAAHRIPCRSQWSS